MQLETIPFSNSEKKINFTIEIFKERGKEFAMLVESDNDEIPKTDAYRFGHVSLGGSMHWFFNGMATTKDRIKAIEVYNELQKYCRSKNLGQAFAYKEYEKRE